MAVCDECLTKCPEFETEIPEPYFQPWVPPREWVDATVYIPSTYGFIDPDEHIGELYPDESDFDPIDEDHPMYQSDDLFLGTPIKNSPFSPLTSIMDTVIVTAIPDLGDPFREEYELKQDVSLLGNPERLPNGTVVDYQVWANRWPDLCKDDGRLSNICGGGDLTGDVIERFADQLMAALNAYYLPTILRFLPPAAEGQHWEITKVEPGDVYQGRYNLVRFTISLIQDADVLVPEPGMGDYNPGSIIGDNASQTSGTVGDTLSSLGMSMSFPGTTGSGTYSDGSSYNTGLDFNSWDYDTMYTETLREMNNWYPDTWFSTPSYTPDFWYNAESIPDQG